MPESVRWAVPLTALLLASLFQHAGLYYGTRSYVRQMDELHWRTPDRLGGGALDDLLVLDDALSGLASALGGWQAWEAAASVAARALPVVWAARVTRAGDLGLWTRALLCGALLLLLKGALAWSTVVQDAQGWKACEARLGPDGLKYYRLEAGAAEALADVALLAIRGLWAAGEEQRGRFCADAGLSSPTCLCALFSLSLLEVLQQTAQTQRYARVAAHAALGLLVAASALLPVLHRCHYTLDVALALTLTPLVYCSPPVVIAVDCWVNGLPADWLADAGDGPAASGVDLPELGSVSAAPCCPAPTGVFYLRTGPGRLDPCSDAPGSDVLAAQVARFRTAQEGLRERRRKAEDALRAEQAAAEPRAERRARELQDMIEETLLAQQEFLDERERELLSGVEGDGGF